MNEGYSEITPRLLPDGRISLYEDPENRFRTNAMLSDAETDLARSGAELDVFLHTRNQKRDFDGALGRYLELMAEKTDARVAELAYTGASEAQISQDVITSLVDSKRAVLETDTHHKLGNYLFERIKLRIAGSTATRVAGQLASVAIAGGLVFAAVKGIETSNSKKKNLLVIGSALGTQLGLRSLGERAKNYSHDQLDEYVPTNGSNSSPEKGQLQRHVDHVVATENELYKIATTHYSENPGDHTSLTPKLIDGMGKWYKEYYRQPTLRDRAETLAIGAFTLTALTTTIVLAHNSD